MLGVGGINGGRYLQAAGPVMDRADEQALSYRPPGCLVFTRAQIREEKAQRKVENGIDGSYS